MQERAVQISIQERYHEDNDTLLQLSGTEYGQSCPACSATTLGLHPVIHVPNYMDYYSFTDP